MFAHASTVILGRLVLSRENISPDTSRLSHRRYRVTVRDVPNNYRSLRCCFLRSPDEARSSGSIAFSLITSSQATGLQRKIVFRPSESARKSRCWLNRRVKFAARVLEDTARRRTDEYRPPGFGSMTRSRAFSSAGFSRARPRAAKVSGGESRHRGRREGGVQGRSNYEEPGARSCCHDSTNGWPFTLTECVTLAVRYITPVHRRTRFYRVQAELELSRCLSPVKIVADFARTMQPCRPRRRHRRQ